jgi:fatty acid CoA ligase FadD28
VVLTTSAVIGNITEYVQPQPGQPAPSIVEVDLVSPDSPKRFTAELDGCPSTAYLQYTSGSTREPTGVVVSHRNVLANFEQKASNYFPQYGGVGPPDTTTVSWLPFYHDMGLIFGICAPVLWGCRTVLMSPVAFLQRPARWMQLVASNFHAWTGAPNFAFELATRKTSDADMAGLDLGNVLGIISGSERIHPATLRRFTERFARSNLRDSAILPSYGLAEGTAFVATRRPGNPPEFVHFESEKLSAGHAKRCGSGGGTPLVSYGAPFSPMVRIVDRETGTECPAGTIGEIWVHGDNVAVGYWRKPQETESTFNARLVAPSAGTPEGPWLRTGDLGFFSEGELFIMGRIKDLLIVYGRNHYPEDIEATIQEITRGRAAAISVPGNGTEKLGDTEEEAAHKLNTVKGEVASAISNSHGLSVADLVLVAPGSIPTTTSGKVRRAACVEQYRHDEFTRIDV